MDGGHKCHFKPYYLIYEDKDYKAKPRIQIIIFTNSKKLGNTALIKK